MTGMRSPFFCGVGGVVSADIAVSEHEREVAFYSSVLTTGESPLWREDLMNSQGTPIIGLGARTPEYESLPLQWTPHFQVADVYASADVAIANGANELMRSDSADKPSQWAGLIDPDGAAFGLISTVPPDSAYTQQGKSIGCISWLSLASANAQASCDFYEKVIGWKAVPSDAGDKFEMTQGEHVAAEIHQAVRNDNRIASVWLIHIPVGDLTESLHRVRSGGGDVVEQSGKLAIIRDPVGVHFALQAG